MKVNIEVVMTPEEYRKAMGLPDVQKFQEDLMAKIRQQMEEGVEGYEPLALMKPFISQGFDSVETYQKMMMQMLNSYTQQK